MFFLGLLVPIAYVPNWTGQMILTGWVVLSCVLPFVLLRHTKMTLGHWLGVIFLCYATLSLCWTLNTTQAVWDLWVIAVLAGCFMLGAARDCRQLYLGLAFGIGINTLLLPIEHWWPNLIFMTNPAIPAGLFVNYDMLGESALLVSLGLMSQRLWWPLVMTLPSVLFVESRSIMLALAVVSLFAFWNAGDKRFVALCVIVGLCSGSIYTLYHINDGSVGLRLAMYMDTIDGLTRWGHGPGSFFSLYPEFASRTDTMFTRPESVHNDFLEMVFEFGVGAIPLLALVWLGLITAGPQRYVLAAWCVIAMVSFPIRIPTEGLVGMVALGSMFRGWPVAWNNRAGCRSIWDLWKLRQVRSAVPVQPIHPNPASI